MKIKTSAYHIAVFLYRWGFVILTLPLQTIFLKDTAASVSVYLINLALSVSVIVCACVHFKTLCFRKSDKAFSFKEGFAIKNRTLIPDESIKAISQTQGPLQKFLKICRFTLHFNTHRISIYIKIPAAKLTLCGRNKSTSRPRLHIRSKTTSSFLFSLGFFNAFTGALTLIPFFRKLYILTSAPAGNRQSLLPSFVYTGLPALLFVLSAFIIILWLMGVVLNFLRYAGLSLISEGNSLFTCRGIFVKRSARVLKKEISAVTFKQNLLFILLGRYAGEFATSCNRKDNRIIFLCAARRKECSEALRKIAILPKKESPSSALYSVSLFGHTYLPLGLLLLFSLLMIFADEVHPYISSTRIGLFIILWLTGWFLFRLSIFNRCFVSFNRKYATIGFYRGFTYYSSVIPIKKVRGIKITESVFQRRKGTCSLHIFIKGRKTPFSLKHTEKEKAAEFVTKLCGPA